MKPAGNGLLKETSALVPIAFKRRIFDPDGIYRDVRHHGETIAEMILSIPELPDDFWSRGVVCINGDPVYRGCWHIIKPHATAPDRPIIVTMHLGPHGGGGGEGGKGGVGMILGLVAAVALTVATAGIATFGVAALGIAGGTFGASLLAGGVGLVGALAISALTAPPAVQAAEASGTGSAGEAKEAASAEGNQIAPGGAIPRVLGTRKTFPPLAVQALTELVEEDEIVEVVLILNGPHLLSEIRIGDATIDESEDVDFRILEGWQDDEPQDFITRQGYTTAPNIELSTHAIDSEDPFHLKHQANPSLDLPVWHTVATRNSFEEVWLHFALPQGLSKNAETTNDRTIPIRVRMRKRGDPDWINLPELHLSDRTMSQRRRAIIFRYGTEPVVPSSPSRSGWIYANNAAPGQTVVPFTTGWDAHAYFNSGVGNSYFYRGNESSSSVQHIHLYDNRVEVFLDETTFPKGIYDIQVKRGHQFDTSTFDKTAYTYSGNSRDFFAYFTSSGDHQISVARENLAEVIQLTRVCSVWNETPTPLPGFAMILLKARNRRVENVSCIASGYVQDWDGTGWNTWTTTSNPAPHYVDVLSGRLNLDPLPEDLRDDVGLVSWRTKCTANGWTCDTIADDTRTQDILQLLASCGYAKPYQSEIYGVTVDDDRSADSPIQIFSPRNGTNFRWERSFPRLPDGFIVTFRDASDDYNDAQEIVYREGYSGGDSGILETITYDGLVDRDRVIVRAKFDLDQAMQRGTFYYYDVDLEAILCRRGDLVGIQHDTMMRRTASALVKRKVLSGGNITSLVLETKVALFNEPDLHAVTDIHTVADVHLVGLDMGMLIRREDGTISSHDLSNVTGETDTVTLATPIADTVNIVGLETSGAQAGSLVALGPVDSEIRRCVVHSMAPASDFRFTLALVDEAPDLVRTP